MYLCEFVRISISTVQSKVIVYNVLFSDIIFFFFFNIITVYNELILN
jgi:hypothetical protein